MRQAGIEKELEVLSEELEYKSGEDETCVHYWLLESALGHKSRGRCKLCGAEREFLNSIPDYSNLRPSSSFFDLPGLKDIAFDGEPEELEAAVA